MSAALPDHCSALGLTLTVRPGDPASLPVPDTAWRPAELMERPTRVAVLPLAPGVHRLALERFGDYTVDLGAGVVDVHRQPEPGIALAEVLEGPVLLHALAARGIHALHASAFQLPDGRVLAFTADSGTGKSSLAARAQARGWVRVADDLLALKLDRGGIVALPGLYQPKLAATEQPGTRLPERLALAGLFRLRRTRGPTDLHLLDAGAACALLLWATVATRVYTPASLAEHLGFAARFAEAVRLGKLQVATLDLPDRPEDVTGALDEVLDLLMRIDRNPGPVPTRPPTQSA